MKAKSPHSRIAFGWIVGVRREVLKKIGLLAERELRRPRAPIVAPEERSVGTAECYLGGVDAPDEAPQPEKVLETDRLTGVRGTAISTQAD